MGKGNCPRSWKVDVESAPDFGHRKCNLSPKIATASRAFSSAAFACHLDAPFSGRKFPKVVIWKQLAGSDPPFDAGLRERGWVFRKLALWPEKEQRRTSCGCFMLMKRSLRSAPRKSGWHCRKIVLWCFILRKVILRGFCAIFNLLN